MKNHPLIQAIFNNSAENELKHLKLAHKSIKEAQISMDDAMLARESRVARGASDEVGYGRAVEKSLMYSAWMVSDYITDFARKSK